MSELLARGREVLRATSTATRVALGLIAAQTLLRCWQTFGGNFWQDDFVFLRLAREWGLSGRYLGHDHNGHLQPLGWLMSWVSAQLPGQYWPSAVMIVLLQLAASVAVWRLLVDVVGDSPASVVGLAVYLFTPLAVPTVTWWASFVITVPLHLAMALAALCHRRWLDGGGVPWLAGAVGSMIGGLLVTEKAVLIPVFVLVLSWMTHRGGWREFLRAQLRQLPALILYGVVAVAYLALYFRVVESPDNAVRTVGQFWRILSAQLLDVFPTGILGGPWGDTFADSMLFQPSSPFVLAITAQVFLVLAVVGWWRRGAQSLLVWAGLICYLLVNVAITAIGRGAWGELLAQDPRYLSDAIPLAAVAVALLLSPARAPRTAADGWSRGHSMLVAVLLAVLLFNSSMVSVSQLAPQMKHEQVARYVENVRGALAVDPNLNLWDQGAPQDIMVAAFPDEDKQISSVLAAYGVHPRFDVTSSSMRILDDSGVPRRPVLSFPTAVELDEDETCPVQVSAGRTERVEFEEYVPAGRSLMEVGYFTSGRGVLTIDTGERTYQAGLDEGSRAVFLVFDGGTQALDLTLEDGRGTVCVTSLNVGYPIPDLGDGG